MDGATELRFEDLSKRSQAQLLAPLSEHELLQQLHQQTEQGSMQRGNEQTQNPAQDSSVEGRSAASRQVRLAGASIVVLMALVLNISAYGWGGLLFDVSCFVLISQIEK